MKVSRIILVTLFLFSLVVVPTNSKKSKKSKKPKKIDFDLDYGFGSGLTVDDQEQKLVDDEKQNPKTGFDKGHLKQGFYSESCPTAEKIVADALVEITKTNPNAIANIIRLQFHDCFVVGCDSSVLLDYTPTGDKVEKSSMLNGQLLKGTDFIDDIKAKLEEQCPGIVSCTDTIAFSVNEGMFLSGLPRTAPLGGRRDALYSLASIAEDDNLPMPNWPMEKMVDLFTKKGFTIEEMVILLGAHSIGVAHCDVFMERIYNYADTRKPDPLLPFPIVNELQQICANPGTPLFRNPVVNFDETPALLDNLFFKNMVTKKKTLLVTDAHLFNDPRTIPIVEELAKDNGLFQKKFAEAMVKMGSYNVITGNDGEVRKTCRSTN